jgi:hypothetical protein
VERSFRRARSYGHAPKFSFASSPCTIRTRVLYIYIYFDSNFEVVAQLTTLYYYSIITTYFSDAPPCKCVYGTYNATLNPLSRGPICKFKKCFHSLYYKFLRPELSGVRAKVHKVSFRPKISDLKRPRNPVARGKNERRERDKKTSQQQPKKKTTATDLTRKALRRQRTTSSLEFVVP